jgi:hypothetical protein
VGSTGAVPASSQWDDPLTMNECSGTKSETEVTRVTLLKHRFGSRERRDLCREPSAGQGSVNALQPFVVANATMSDQKAPIDVGDLPAAGAYEYGDFIGAGVLPFCVNDAGNVRFARTSDDTMHRSASVESVSSRLVCTARALASRRRLPTAFRKVASCSAARRPHLHRECRSFVPNQKRWNEV